MSDSAPIGIFDSGVGGLTVARSVIDQLPWESIIYVGDTAHGPYGPLTSEEVREHSRRVADGLVAEGCKMLVIACNTATAAFLSEARERYDVPVLEVIQPAVRRAVVATHSGRVGVIGTEGTVRSGAYPQAFTALAPEVDVTAVACPHFVDFVERGVTSGRQIVGLAQAYLEPLQRAEVDTLVLGCTHYPLLSGILQMVMGDDVTLVSSAEETSKDVLRVLTETDALTPATTDPAGAEPALDFRSTGEPEIFRRLATRFVGPRLSAVHPASGPRRQGS